MSKVSLGDWVDNKHDVKLDLPRLLETRLLMQANSGNGKSWLLRRLLEVTNGKVQQLIIDPEGEFASLREKFDLVICAAKGGDAATHPRTAALLATRLLETQASAVLDISDLRVPDRHAFVRLFLTALIEAPKALRHSVMVALDEAQIFAPEKGQGESEASAAVIDIASRGRKRGLCLVAATQRISMLHKAVAGECKNRLIGGTSLDVDVKRAAFDLGMPPTEALTKLRALEPGHFYAFGPALGQLEPRELVAGAIETTHPKVGHRQWTIPPKPTAAILALLPKLADLPKEAEEQARSMEELKRELATARRELTQAKKAQPAALATAPAIDRGAEKRQAAAIARLKAVIEELMKFIVTINARDFTAKTGETVDAAALTKAIEAAVGQARKLIESGMETRNRELQAMQRQGGQIVARIQKLLEQQDVKIAVEVKHNEPFTVEPKAQTPKRAPAPPRTNGDGSITNPQQRLLDKLAWLEDHGIHPAPKATLAAVTGVSPNSGSYYNNLGALRTAGYIDYPSAGEVGFTDEGRAIAQASDDRRPIEEHWLDIVTGPQRKILEALIGCHPDPMTKEALADQIGVSGSSGSYYNNLGRLRTLGAIDYPRQGSVALTRHVKP